MNPPTAGLRPIHHNAVSAEKVTVVIQPGDVLEVSDDVADQLKAHSPQFQEPAKKAPAKKTAAKKKAG